MQLLQQWLHDCTPTILSELVLPEDLSDRVEVGEAEVRQASRDSEMANDLEVP